MSSENRTVDNVEFWENFYQRKFTPWDLGQAAPPFDTFLHSPDAMPAGNMAVLGCGAGHECLLFASRGFTVTAIDFAPSAISAVTESFEKAGVLGTRGLVLQRDVFDLQDLEGQFDYVLEHTCFCAIHPSRRKLYAQQVLALLKPEGKLIGLWWLVDKPGNPPYAVSKEDILSAFSDYFRLDIEFKPVDSVADREGKELFTVMSKIS